MHYFKVALPTKGLTMSKHVRCSCGTTVKIPENFRGSRIYCPKCSAPCDLKPDAEKPVAGDALKETNLPNTSQDVFEIAAQSVVFIESKDAIGSGIVMDPEGVIATNKHVVGSNKSLTVRLSDGAEFRGRTICAYRDIDLAFAKIHVEPEKWAKIGDSSKLRLGQTVYALGHPYGLSNTLTKGIVSSIGRLIGEVRYIQTDASINPGNSGGPLLTESAEVVGMNTLSLGESEGIGFAIPTETILERYQTVKSRLSSILSGVYCPVCGKTTVDSRYCETCGAKLSEDLEPDGESAVQQEDSPGVKICPTCKAKSDGALKYCQRCGTNL